MFLMKKERPTEPYLTRINTSTKKLDIKINKLADFSRERPEDSLLNSYYV